MISISFNEKDWQEAVEEMYTLSDRLQDFVRLLMAKFAGKFRVQVESAFKTNPPWASNKWTPLSAKYAQWKLKNGFSLKHWNRTGILRRSIFKTDKIRRAFGNQGTMGGDLSIDLMEGLVENRTYPKTYNKVKLSKKPATTLDVLMWNEYGTKRIPARPIIMPAFWRTAEMMKWNEEFMGIVSSELKRKVLI